MTLAASGQMSIGGTVTNRSINLELSRAFNATSSLGETALRTLAGVPSGAISLGASFYGKSSITISLAGLQNVYGLAYPGDFATAELIFNSNGTVDQNTSDGGFQSNSTWVTPTTAGIGSSYWVRFTQTASSGAGQTEYGSPRGVWVSLSGSPNFGVSRTANGAGYRQYTVEIASDSGGSNIVATKTNVELNVEIIF